MKLNSTDYKELSNIVSEKIQNPSRELEARLIVSKNNGIGVKDGLIINHNKFFKIVNFLRQDKKYGGLGLNMTNTISLDIIHNIRTNQNGEFQKKNIRYEFYDRDLIKELWINEDDTLMNILNINDDKKENEKYKISMKERLNNYDIDNYNIRVSLSDEIIVNDKNMLKDINTLNTNRQKSYRYKNRYSFITEDGQFRYDLTMVKNSSGRSLKTSNVLNNTPTFEVEVEYIGSNSNDSKIDNLIKQLLIYSSNLLQIYQGSNTIVDTKEVKQVMVNFSKYSSVNIGYRYNTNSNKNRRVKRLTVNPVTMQQIHLSDISKDYALTYKADGERYLIYVDDLSSEVYLIHEKSKTLLKIGVKLPKWSGTIVEGEYISYENTILCYDVLFSKGNDVRKKDLKERYEQAQKLSEDYQKEVENFSNEVINISLKEYIFSEGKKIYKESKHLWNARNSKFYNVDGLIYTPSDKGYNDMKNKLYKWKPVSLNSIDFLIKTVKDPTTGQDIIRSDLLDNGTQIQYKEVKLMVGGKIRGQKNIKAVDFKPKVGYYEGINIAKIILNNNGNMVASDPLSGEIEEFSDDTIIEFIYDKDSDYSWKPIRVRWDKTENYKTAPEGRKNYGNFESIANDNWKSIVKDISEEDLFSGEIQERNNNTDNIIVEEDIIEVKENKDEDICKSEEYKKIFYEITGGYKDKELYNSLCKDLNKTHKPIITYDDIKYSLPYHEASNILKPNTHIGQRKLLLSEVQFLSDVNSNIKYCIYAGSAPGNKTHFLYKLFPHIKFILVDPNKFDLKLADETTLNIGKVSHRSKKHDDIIHLYYEYATKSHTYKDNKKVLDMSDKEQKELINFIKDSSHNIFIIEDYYTVDISILLNKLGNDNICFISDVRTKIISEEETPVDLDIIWNTSMFYNWIYELQPEMTMFKMRLPFYNDGNTSVNKYSKDYESSFNLSKKNGIDFIKNYNEGKFILPKGVINIQAWSRIISTETRLIINKEDINNLVNYDHKEYESKLLYYNSINRGYFYHTNPNSNKKLGFCHNNDCALENVIWTKYIESVDKPILSNVIDYVKITDRITNRPLSKVNKYPIYSYYNINSLKKLISRLHQDHEKYKSKKSSYSGKKGNSGKEDQKEANKERRPSVTFKDVVEVKEFNNINPPIDVNISANGDVYYKNTGSSKNRSITQKFHNQIKSDLYTDVRKLSTGGKLLEIGSGRAGDIHKWRANKYNEVVGIEYSSENIKHAEKRLSAMKKNKKLAKTLGKITFIHGDFNEPIYPDYQFAISEANKLKAKDELVAKYSFDVVSCQFALHYFFKSKETVRQMIENVSDSLKKGGYFIGTAFDGKRVFDSLKKKEKIEGINFEDEVVWTITKDYNEKKFLVSKPNYGMSIDVFIESIGTTNKEYLINFKYFIKIMKKNGFQLVELKSFSEIYDNYLKKSEDEEDEDDRYSKLNLDDILPYEQFFSFFYNSFVFKKIKDVKTIVA